jgi:opacity protein-like surface antigen
MGSWKKQATLIAFAVMPLSGAYAADPAYPPLVQDAPMFVEEYGTGWYLRGDIGYRFNSVDEATAYFPPDPFNNRLGDAMSFGGGVGFKSGWFRGDVTVDYSHGRYSGDAAIPNDYQLTLRSTVALANVYADLGTWYRITPYVGMGLGASFIQGSDLVRQSLPNFGDAASGREVNFAWAAMAGFSYPIMRNLLIDIGYRYLDLGRAGSDFDIRGNKLTVDGITSHEVRAGIRYNFE